jgi:hypothetical protein
MNMPIGAGSRINDSIVEKNYHQLANAKTVEDVATPVALKAYNAYKNAQIGVLHHVKKYATSVAAYGTAIGIPVSIVGGTTYWLFKDALNHAYNNPADFFEYKLNIIRNNEQLLTNNTVLIGQLIDNLPAVKMMAEYTTPASFLAAAAAVGLVDRAVHTSTGFTPIGSVMKWSVNMMSSILFYSAYKAGEIISSTYDQQEQAQNMTRLQSHQLIIKNLKCTYDDIANRFMRQCEEMEMNPSAMLELRSTAYQLETCFSTIATHLAKLELSDAEICQIMDRLITVTKQVKHVALDLRISNSPEDRRYNTELLSILSEDEFASKAVTTSVKRHIETAKNHTPGTLDGIKSSVSIASKTLAAGISTQIALTAFLAAGSRFSLESNCTQTFEATDCSSEKPLLAASLVLSLGAMHSIYRRFSNTAERERQHAEMKRIENTDAAFRKLITIYNGVAENLNQQFNIAKYNRSALAELKTNAARIAAKLPTIKSEIASTGIIENAAVITEDLETVLNAILK